ncbi:carbohydrate ABC transporter permease [Paenibacillus spongiae]|uniref:Carbohydrate ABC transporter permease n=1 Tax=Paenibacillus spongiae TaxID=2909671 RepID=A0ABY5SHA6_9BACL|nr:carbohydrate ABC transporter permease [Paenibacillus spongiae]UVI33382.1 carbohydrate ABC transporter permease [Paenibacillus spongiae]
MRNRWTFFDGFIYAALLILSLTTLYPFIYVIAYSLNDGMDSMRGGIYMWPRKFTLENYITVLQDVKILRAYWITISRTVVGTVLHVFLNALFAYALTKHSVPGRKFFILLIFLPVLFNAGFIPNFILYRELGLINTFWVYIIPSLYSFFHILILRTFFDQLPEGLIESARIDGCNEFGIYFRIILPLSGPVMATISLFVGVGHWNDWFTGTFYVNDENLIPVQTLLQQLLTQSQALAEAASGSNSSASAQFADTLTTTPESLRMSTLVIAVLPIMCVYPFLQRYFVKGAMLGSIKG